MNIQAFQAPCSHGIPFRADRPAGAFRVSFQGGGASLPLKAASCRRTPRRPGAAALHERPADIGGN
jgi:hypothetical protein